MKLRNKKTGEIVDTLCSDDITKGLAFGIDRHDGNPTMAYYNSLAELNKEWEDYEEPKGHWYINSLGEVEKLAIDDRLTDAEKSFILDSHLEIGNYFETKEEAELAVEKLEAWKRLKDKGFRFIDHIDRDSGQGMTRYEWDGYVNGEDLDLLFGGEE